MKILDPIQHRVTKLLTTPGEELGRWARFARQQISLWQFCFQRLRRNNAMAMSSALSFRTIFALVPLLILSFLALKSLGVVENRKELLRQFMAESGLDRIVAEENTHSNQPGTSSDPTESTTQISLADRIEEVMEHVESQLTVGRLGPLGVVLMVWTALTLLTTIERCLNRIFEAPKTRSLGRRILLYWSAVTLGPLVLFVVVYAGREAVSAVANMPEVSSILGWISWIGSVLVGVLLLAAFYTLLPNTRVSFRAAVGGAIVALPLWLLARWGLTVYVEKLGRHSIYGAVGLIPLFLMWLNLSWWLFLFGAELAHTAANLSLMQWADRKDRHLIRPWELLAATVTVARRHQGGQGPSRLAEVSESLTLPADAAEQLLSSLAESGVLCRVDDPQMSAYALSRPLAHIAVSEILELTPDIIHDESQRRYQAPIAEIVSDVKRRVEMGIEHLTLADIIPIEEQAEQTKGTEP